MDVSIARQIITEAKAADVYDDDAPEDDASAIEVAEGLVEMAEQAWTSGVREPEVEIILKLSNSDGKNHNGAEPEVEADETPTVEERAITQESSDGPEREFSDPDELTKVEPWEGYTDASVSEVTEGVNFYIEDGGDDLVDILTHVYAYETAHKDRVRVLNHVKSQLEKLGVINEEQPAEDQSQAAEPQAAEEPQETSDGDDGTDATDAESEPVTEATPARSEKARPTADSSQAPEEDQSRSGAPDGSLYGKLRETVDSELKAERGHIPSPPADEVPELPWRWSEITDEQLQDFHMQYAAYAYWKSYVYARDERIAMHAKEAADELRNKLMVEIDKYDDHNKEKKVGLIEAEIESSDAVRKWRRIQRRSEQMALVAKREMESYYKLVEHLSRLESMRHQSWERSRR